MDYIRNHPDLVFVGEYMDDGVSGTKFDKRDELQRMLQDVEKGKIDLIIFTKLDRFFRSVRHLMNTLDYLDSKGVEWNAIEENHNNSTPTGKLALTIMGAFSEMEANMGSIRVKDAFRNKMSKKEWLNSIPPFGYRIVDKHAVPDPEKADIVRRMYKDYIKHGNFTRIVRDYAPLGAPKSHKGIKQLLTNRVYIGEKHGVPDYVEPIIDIDTFNTVQRLTKMNVTSAQKHTYIFSSLIFCPVCEKPLGGSCKGIYGRYRCRYYAFEQCSYNKNHSERKIEKFLIDRYKEDLEQRYLTLKEVKKKDNSQRINSLYRKIDRLKDLYINELIDLKEYKEDLEKYRKEIAELEVPQETNVDRIEKLMEMNVYEIYWTLTNEQKRRLWRSVVKRIVPTEDSFFVEYL